VPEEHPGHGPGRRRRWRDRFPAFADERARSIAVRLPSLLEVKREEAVLQNTRPAHRCFVQTGGPFRLDVRTSHYDPKGDQFNRRGVGRSVAKDRLVPFEESFGQIPDIRCRCGIELDGQRGFLSLATEFRDAAPDLLALFPGCLVAQFRKPVPELGAAGERAEDLPFRETFLHRMMESKRAEYSGLDRNENRRDAELLRQSAGVQGPGPAKRNQGMRRRIRSFPHGDRVDAVRHLFDRDLHQAV